MTSTQTKINKLTKAIDTINNVKTSEPVKKTEKKQKVKVQVDSDDMSDVETDFKSFNIQQTDKELTYKKLELHSQILLRPDTYIGSVKNVLSSDQIYIFDDNKIVKKQISYPDGFIRIFIEVISNAIDNVWQSIRSKITPRFIKVSINKDNNTVSVWNDGRNITVKEHPEVKVPIPEMIFGQLLTSSNYNDEEERKTSGRNGYGVKLCNIFSNSFSVKIYNKDEACTYEQTWSKNMYDISKPKISTTKSNFPKTVEDGKNGYTCVTFQPDLSRFGLKEITDDIYNLMKKIVYDTAMTVSLNNVKTYFNDEVIKVDGIKDYVSLYFDSLPEEHMLLSSDDSRVMIVKSNEYNHVSFVNGIYTKDGGVHVDAWCEDIFRPIINKINDTKTKNKDRKKINISDVKKHFFIFVYGDLDKPSFDSQSKTKLNGPPVKTNIKKNDVPRLMKWSFIQKIEEMLMAKDLSALKTETERKRGQVKVEGLDDANLAGGKNSKDCILCISEGLSAASYIVGGMTTGINNFKGHDHIGVLPIRGKFLNVRNTSFKTLVDNKEVKAIIQSLGLETGIDYSDPNNFKKLRYGKIMLCSDADVDGFHITGLLYNFFHTLFPSLLKIEGFFNFMRVPIVKITQKGKTISFFNQYQANKYIEENKIKKDNIKYFKGLGTAVPKDIKEDFGRRVVAVVDDEKSDEMMNNIFAKENSDFRKEWLKTYDPVQYSDNGKDYQTEKLPITSFLNNELINFSIDDCKRSIPSLIDGLKESHRKVLYTAFKRKLLYTSKSLKVAQFAGSVAEESNYHHGEQNLYDTITKLAQRFVGSNNVPLLFDEGQFGDRLEMGKNAANGRYIFTKLDILTKYIFREEDDQFLINREDDGDLVEKNVYMPIVPMILINGCNTGIGTGWSCSVLPYNIADIIDILKKKLSGEESDCNLKPYFRNFKGQVDVEGTKVTTKGVFSVIDEKKRKYRITEIPLGKKNISISKYKSILETLQEEGKIKNIVNQSDNNNPDFTVTCAEDFDVTLESLELVDTYSTSNMVLFDKDEKIKKYDTVKDIIYEYFEERLRFYDVRKNGILNIMKHDLLILRNKIKFIEAVTTDKITLKDKSTESLEEELKKKAFDRLEDSYDYLLNIPVRGLTGQKLKELKEKEVKSVKEISDLASKKIQTMWNEELDELLVQYNKWNKR